VFTASKAAGNLSLWIRAVVDTYGALLVVEPKKKQLAEAEEKLSSAEKILAEKKAALEEVLSLLRKLEDEYQTAKKKEEELKKNVERCIVQLDRAEKLIKGLGGEKIAWGKKVIEWKEEKETVLGDCVLCSGIIAYLGAFPITYRD
jgi:dynein heavy chain, axonemal